MQKFTLANTLCRQERYKAASIARDSTKPTFQHHPELLRNMCIVDCRKYDCIQCQRRIYATEQLCQCSEAIAGRSCETVLEFETTYLPADQCAVCKERRKEEEAQAAADSKTNGTR